MCCFQRVCKILQSYSERCSVQWSLWKSTESIPPFNVGIFITATPITLLRSCYPCRWHWNQKMPDSDSKSYKREALVDVLERLMCTFSLSLLLNNFSLLPSLFKIHIVLEGEHVSWCVHTWSFPTEVRQISSRVYWNGIDSGVRKLIKFSAGLCEKRREAC